MEIQPQNSEFMNTHENVDQWYSKTNSMPTK